MIVDQIQTIYSNINKKKKRKKVTRIQYSIQREKQFHPSISRSSPPSFTNAIFQPSRRILLKEYTFLLLFHSRSPPNIQRSFRAFPSPPSSPFKPINSRFWWSRRQRQSFAFQEPPLRSLHTVPGWTRSKKVSPSRGTGSVSKLSLNWVQGLETIEQCRGHGRVSPRGEWNQ